MDADADVGGYVGGIVGDSCGDGDVCGGGDYDRMFVGGLLSISLSMDEAAVQNNANADADDDAHNNNDCHGLCSNSLVINDAAVPTAVEGICEWKENLVA